jgi:hypothetical protein
MIHFKMMECMFSYCLDFGFRNFNYLHCFLIFEKLCLHMSHFRSCQAHNVMSMGNVKYLVANDSILLKIYFKNPSNLLMSLLWYLQILHDSRCILSWWYFSHSDIISTKFKDKMTKQVNKYVMVDCLFLSLVDQECL